MKFLKTSIPGLIICEPKKNIDKRGFFTESFRKDLFEKFYGNKINFCQENLSESSYGVLRGMHFQKEPYAQSKLVSVHKGKILDVVVDIRKNSKFYGKHFSIELNETNNKQLFVPKGFAHGFLCLDKENIIVYNCSNYRAAKYEKILKWDDKNLKINWGIKNPILSKRDQNGQGFDEFIKK